MTLKFSVLTPPAAGTLRERTSATGESSEPVESEMAPMLRVEPASPDDILEWDFAEFGEGWI